MLSRTCESLIRVVRFRLIAVICILPIFSLVSCGQAEVVQVAPDPGVSIRGLELDDAAYAGLATPLPALPTSWSALERRSWVTTDSTGQAEIDIGSCHHIFIFRKSSGGLTWETCSRGAPDPNCVDVKGSSYFEANCAPAISVFTEKAKVQANSTVYAVTYLPDQELTILETMEGTVTLTNLETGEETMVAAEEFAFSSPTSSPIADLNAEQAYPRQAMGSFEDAGSFIREVSSFDTRVLFWTDDIRIRTIESGVAPDAYFPTPPDGLLIWGEGGILDQPQIGDAVILGIDLDTVQNTTGPNESVMITLPGRGLGEANEIQQLAGEDVGIDTASSRYFPESSLALLQERGYEQPGLTLVRTDDTPALQETADVMAESLLQAGFAVEELVVPAGDLFDALTELDQSGQAYLLLQE